MRRTVTARELHALDLLLAQACDGDKESLDRYSTDLATLLPTLVEVAYCSLNTMKAEKLAYLIKQPDRDECTLHGISKADLRDGTYKATKLSPWLLCVMHDLKRDSLSIEAP